MKTEGEIDKPTPGMEVPVSPTVETDWFCLGQSVCGLAHELAQPVTGCQDFSVWMKIPERAAVFGALSDGAGSAKHAAVASELACKSALKHLFDLRQVLPWNDLTGEEWKPVLMKTIEVVRARLEAIADRHHADLRQYACTLIVFLATPSLAVCVQVGDGAVIIEDMDGQLTSLTTSPPSEFLNQTRMLTAADLIADVTCWPVNLRSIAAFSDGLQLLCTTYPDGRPHIPFFGPMFRFLNTVNDKATGQAQLKKFLGQQHIRRASGDDLTLMLGTIRAKVNNTSG